VQGKGPKQTEKFTVGGDWDLEWSYECNGRPPQFTGTVYNDKGLISGDTLPFHASGPKSAGLQQYHKGGTYSVFMNTLCTWHVVVKE